MGKENNKVYTTYEALPLMLSVGEVGNVLGISRAQAYILVNSAGFPKVPIGKRICVPKQGLIDWINHRTQST